MTAVITPDLPQHYGDARRRAITTVGIPAPRPPATPAPALVDARVVPTREQLLAIAATGADDGDLLGAAAVEQLCDGYIDAVVDLEVAGQRAARAESQAAAERGVCIALQRLLDAERAHSAGLQRQLEARIHHLTLAVLHVQVDEHHPRLGPGRWSHDPSGAPGARVIDISPPAQGGDS